MELELANLDPGTRMASLGSLIAGEPAGSATGGFIFPVPLTQQLSRASLVQAALWDMANCICENFRVLLEISSSEPQYLWGCGGGFRNRLFTQYLSNLTGKPIRLRLGYQHATVVGGAMLCQHALISQLASAFEYETVFPDKKLDYRFLQQQWLQTRRLFTKKEELPL